MKSQGKLLRSLLTFEKKPVDILDYNKEKCSNGSMEKRMIKSEEYNLQKLENSIQYSCNGELNSGEDIDNENCLFVSSPCYSDSLVSVKNESTLEDSLNKCIDTTDLEEHFNYYWKEPKKLTRTIGTDTRDLEYPINYRSLRSISIGTDDGPISEDASFSAESCIAKQLKDNEDCLRSEEIDTESLDHFDNNSEEENSEFEENSKHSIKQDEGTRNNESQEVIENLQNRKKRSENGAEDCFDCGICSLKFKKKNFLLKHIKRHEKSVFCRNKICREKISKVSENCKRNPKEKSSLKENCNARGGMLCRPCDICSKVFNSPQQLRMHRKKIHKTLRNNQKKALKFQCSSCNREFNSKHGLHYHRKVSHLGLKLKVVKRVKRHKCLTCGKMYYGSNALRVHEVVHTGEKKFVCSICSKAFATKTAVRTHEVTHTDLKPWTCLTCEKSFRQKDSLMVHTRKHTGERPFKCNVCPMTFDRKFTLKTHMVTHTGERSHICVHCGKTFGTRSALGTHERQQHSKSGEKVKKPQKRRERDIGSCVCDICGKVYSNQSNLKMHHLTHSGMKPWKCSVCGEAFTKKYTLQCHTRKHTDERPFACDICGQRFYRSSTLKSHKHRHTGERPYVCKICGKSYTQSSGLAYHIRNHNRPVKMSPEKLKNFKKDMKMITSEMEGNGIVVAEIHHFASFNDSNTQAMVVAIPSEMIAPHRLDSTVQN